MGGGKLVGYWFDSWYINRWLAYPRCFRLRQSTVYCKVGRPRSAYLPLTSGFFPVLTPWQDYWGRRAQRSSQSFLGLVYLQTGAGAGFQAHADAIHAAIMGGITKPARFHRLNSGGGGLDRIREGPNMEHQAVTTINIGIYQDGTIEQSFS